MKSSLRLLALTTLVACTSAAGPAVEAEPSAALAPVHPLADFDHSHAAWTKILKKHVRGDRFDYGALKRDRKALDAYTRSLAAVTKDELEGWKPNQRFAFWVNTYNAFTIQKVIDNYPLKSIRDLSGLLGMNSVFDSRFIPMQAHHPDGKKKELSLNDIEHEILRKRFKDARLHAAVNCASGGCPPLRNEAFVAERLDEQLEEQMRSFLADETRNRFDPKEGRMYLSQIFKWFAEDFERDAESVKAYVARFAPAKHAEFAKKAKVRYLDYSWKLNDVRKKD